MDRKTQFSVGIRWSPNSTQKMCLKSKSLVRPVHRFCAARHRIQPTDREQLAERRAPDIFVTRNKWELRLWPWNSTRTLNHHVHVRVRERALPTEPVGRVARHRRRRGPFLHLYAFLRSRRNVLRGMCEKQKERRLRGARKLPHFSAFK